MKKHNTLFVVIFTILFVALLTWILPITYMQGELIEGERVRAGVVNVFAYPFYTFYNFIYVLVYLLGIGAIYGLLNKTGAYRLMLDKVTKIVKNHQILWLTLTVLLLSLITSFTGFTFELLIVLPFIASVVLLLGYDKLTAALITVGSVTVGIIGNTYSALVNGSFIEIIQTLKYEDLILIKFGLLVLSSIILILNVIWHTKKIEKTKDVPESFLIPKKTTSKKIKVWPLVTALSIFFVVLVLSTVNWTGAFKVEFFAKTLESIKGTRVLDKYIVFTVGLLIVLYNVLRHVFANKKLDEDKKKEMSKCRLIITICFGVFAFFALSKIMFEDVFNITNFLTNILETIKVKSLIDTFTFDILLGIVRPLGEWAYPDYYVWMFILALAIKLMYKVKADDFVEQVGDGFKKVLYAALVAMLGYTVFMLTAYHPVVLTILKPVLELTDGLSVLSYPLCTLFSALLNSDFTNYRLHSLTLTYPLNYFTNVSTYPLCALMTQAMYGLAILIAPTSATLLFSISFLDIKYTTWLKKVILLFLELLFISFVAFIIVSKFMI